MPFDGAEDSRRQSCATTGSTFPMALPCVGLTGQSSLTSSSLKYRAFINICIPVLLFPVKPTHSSPQHGERNSPEAL